MRETPLSAPFARPFLRSIRSRTALLATALIVLLMVPACAQREALARQAEIQATWAAVQRQAILTVSAIQFGHLTSPVKPQVPGVDLVQVVGLSHRVLASTTAAHGLAPLTDVWPSVLHPQQAVHSCSRRRLGCLLIAAIRVRPDQGSAVVYAARHVPVGDPVANRRLLIVVEAAALILAAAWTIWRVAGRLLSPIEAISTQLATVTIDNLGRRLPEPSGTTEIALLTRTINSTLVRLAEADERAGQALARQRRFTGDASHELRTPLAGLRVLLEEARLHPGQTEPPLVIRDALSAVDRLEAITTDLLLLAGTDAGTPPEREPVDLSGLVEEETSRRSDRLPVRLRLETGATVKACRIQMGRVLTNLLDNAQRHAAHVVQVEVRREGSVALLVVSDDGTGIADADRERIFERFVRLDAARSRDQGGSGLGLAIARDIAHAHQGTLTAGCSDMGGARFVMRIPLAEY
ncbi:hypothetical protein GCM10023194_23040 [Planotetraspora phitsanulokensis]|uniref:histidine kinase n=1 Tax=Planotetraspora phitsanulokensis TaxID=575192 RepID=A0A8J3XFP1_9ACTN|nr:HAMP domain-containing sensor histidine kinase [Planotetraspora phitsanulokensis]GII38361.1 hypothetical protein Pph01_33640 [Planotetraspora phitsanulokensis]